MKLNPALSAFLLAILPSFAAPTLPHPVQRLPGELSADAILDGAHPFPPTPAALQPRDLRPRNEGFAPDRLGRVPPPGVHPRILFSPEQLPELRRRWLETNVGRALHANLRRRTNEGLRDASRWSSRLYSALAAGDAPAAQTLIDKHKGPPPDLGHYLPWIYALVLESLDALVMDDAVRGRAAATALATYVDLFAPAMERSLAWPLAEDVWRARAPESAALEPLGTSEGNRDASGGHFLGYAYDFAHRYLDEAQRARIRGVIARATAGRVWLGARLPHHFRNWNWVAVGLKQPLLALAIEGEEGYDPRVYRLGVELARDYATYGFSPSGISTEAVGYTQFGLRWANPFFVAAARRGDNLLTHPHLRANLDWYLHTTLPARDGWLSHGDGGDGSPGVGTVTLWRHFFPQDAKAAAVWRSYTQATGSKAFSDNFFLVEPLLWADADPGLNVQATGPAGASGEPLPSGLPLTWHDPVRGSLSARSDWSADALHLQLECRVDSVGASHEHADRGTFTLAALGRTWAKDNFRSIETRHHNQVLVDGLGQGYWPGPGRWLGLAENADAVLAAIDAKEAYNWHWPKQILTENPDRSPLFQHPRWVAYREQARQFQKGSADLLPGERDPRPAVVEFWRDFADAPGSPRLWDEDSWPVRFPHNPVARAFRTVLFARGSHPYVLLVDDIQKDQQERLYEWLMQTGGATELASLKSHDAILCDASAPRGPDGLARPLKGDRQLLVRVVGMNEPARSRDYTSRPSFRLETFERKDTLAPDAIEGSLAGARSFGLDKRFVVASRSTAPDFKILLFPHRAGDPLPVTTWNADRSALTITIDGRTDVIQLFPAPDGRTQLSFGRGGRTLTLP